MLYDLLNLTLFTNTENYLNAETSAQTIINFDVSEQLRVDSSGAWMEIEFPTVHVIATCSLHLDGSSIDTNHVAFFYKRTESAEWTETEVLRVCFVIASSLHLHNVCGDICY